MKPEPAERLRPGPLDFELDAIARLRTLDLETVDDLARRAAFFHVDGDVGFVPGLNLDGPIEGGQVDLGGAGDRKAFLLADNLALRVDADDAGRAERGKGQQRGGPEEWMTSCVG